MPIEDALASPVSIARSTSAVQIEVTLAMDTADRSMPPVNIVSMTPRAMRPNSGNWIAIDCHVRRAKKGPGRTIAKKMSRRTRMRTSLVMYVSFTRKDGIEIRLRAGVVEVLMSVLLFTPLPAGAATSPPGRRRRRFR